MSPSDEPDPKSENTAVISDTHFNSNGLRLKTRGNKSETLKSVVNYPQILARSQIIRGTAAFCAALTVFALTGQTTIQAEDLSYTDLLSRVSALEAELGSQQVKLASCDSCCDDCCTGEPSCGCATCCKTSCCACPAWFVGYELTVLQPRISELGAGAVFDDEFGFGHRLTVGYDGGSGMGARARYWFYNHGHDLVPPAAGAGVGIDMDVLDLEVMLYEQLRNWNLMITGGARYGRAEFNGFFVPTATRGYFEGVGPTASLESIREFGDRGMYLIGNIRGSLLFGDFHTPAMGKFEDDTTVVLENQLGMGMTRELGRATLNLRSVWETQVWTNHSFAGLFPAGLGVSDLGFSGPTSSLELRY